MLDKYHEKRDAFLKDLAKRKKKTKNYDLLEQEEALWPNIETADELYSHYLNEGVDAEYKIDKDVGRSDLGCKDWKMPCMNGQNHLFNILNAYAHYDPEVGYC